MLILSAPQPVTFRFKTRSKILKGAESACVIIAINPPTYCQVLHKPTGNIYGFDRSGDSLGLIGTAKNIPRSNSLAWRWCNLRKLSEYIQARPRAKTSLLLKRYKDRFVLPAKRFVL